MSYQDMKRHGETLNAYDKVKEANLERGHTAPLIPRTSHSGEGKTVDSLGETLTVNEQG